MAEWIGPSAPTETFRGNCYVQKTNRTPKRVQTTAKSAHRKSQCGKHPHQSSCAAPPMQAEGVRPARALQLSKPVKSKKTGWRASTRRYVHVVHRVPQDSKVAHVTNAPEPRKAGHSPVGKCGCDGAAGWVPCFPCCHAILMYPTRFSFMPAAAAM